MKLLFVHAHPDDFEFSAAGTFELWRRRHGPAVERRVLVCTDGAAGHHRRTRAETAALRQREQAAAAQSGGFEITWLHLPDGRIPREAGLQVTPDLLAALWKAIRDFAPDYLFCPPLPADPLAGVHNDHLTIADAVRRVAYLLNVPHAFTPEYPADETASEPCPVPVILGTFDGYLAEGQYDLAVEISPVFDVIAGLTWCHQSQVVEWLPWVDRHGIQSPPDPAAWREQLRALLARRKPGLGITTDGLFEVFSVTAWGRIPSMDELHRDFPALHPGASRLDALAPRLARWRGVP